MDKVISITSFILILLTILLIIPKKGYAKVDKYEWLPSESALENYPMQIVEGYLIYKDDSSLYIPDGKIIRNGLGELLSTHAVGDDFKPIPDRLSILWFSYTEDKFYEGHFDLPFEKISKLFKAGFKSQSFSGHVTYDSIVVGLAPEGEISVFLVEEEILEVARFKAEEVERDWKLILNNESILKADYIKKVLSYEPSKPDKAALLKENAIPAGKWDLYREVYRRQYPWKLKITGGVPTIAWLRTYNGENEFFDFSRPSSNRSHRSIPRLIDLSWTNSKKGEYYAPIVFNQDEIIDAFKKLSFEKGDDEITVEIIIKEKPRSLENTKTVRTIDIFIKNSISAIKLEKQRTEISVTK